MAASSATFGSGKTHPHTPMRVCTHLVALFATALTSGYRTLRRHRGVHNASPWPRHQVALCYSADRVREATIVNSTGLRDLYEQPRRPESELSCAGGFSPPLPHLRFDISCRDVFAAPSLHDVDRNVQLVSHGPLDSWGQPVSTLDVSPQRRAADEGGGAEWSFVGRASFNHLHASAADAAAQSAEGTRRRVEEAELPDWALEVFRREQAASARAKL